jgi:hypothetical protein
MEHEPDTGAWQGISIGDYDSDGNLDVYIAEPPFGGGNATTRDFFIRDMAMPLGIRKRCRRHPDGTALRRMFFFSSTTITTAGSTFS